MSAAMFMRYDPEIYKEDRVRMEPDQDGDYIKFVDAQVEIDRLKALNAELAEALELIDPTGQFHRYQNGNGVDIGRRLAATLAKQKGETS